VRPRVGPSLARASTSRVTVYRADPSMDEIYEIYEKRVKDDGSSGGASVRARARGYARRVVASSSFNSSRTTRRIHHRVVVVVVIALR